MLGAQCQLATSALDALVIARVAASRFIVFKIR